LRFDNGRIYVQDPRNQTGNLHCKRIHERKRFGAPTWTRPREWPPKPKKSSRRTRQTWHGAVRRTRWLRTRDLFEDGTPIQGRQSMSSNRGIQCHITTHLLEDPPDDGITGPQQWLAVATTHIYAELPLEPGLKNRGQMILSTAALRTISGRVTASTEEAAAAGAVTALRFQLAALERERLRST
jgi:hypothetical protein